MPWLNFELSAIAINVSKLDPISPSFGHFFQFREVFLFLVLKILTLRHPLDHCAQAGRSRPMALSFLALPDLK